MHIKVRSIPFQHSKFWIVAITGFFITEHFTNLKYRSTACGKQAFHVIFRACRKPKCFRLFAKRCKKFCAKCGKVQISNAKFTQNWRLNFKQSSLCKKLTNFSNNFCTFKKIFYIGRRLPMSKCGHFYSHF